jgi:hypothetical protein
MLRQSSKNCSASTPPEAGERLLPSPERHPAAPCSRPRMCRRERGTVEHDPRFFRLRECVSLRRAVGYPPIARAARLGVSAFRPEKRHEMLSKIAIAAAAAAMLLAVSAPADAQRGGGRGGGAAFAGGGVRGGGGGFRGGGAAFTGGGFRGGGFRGGGFRGAGIRIGGGPRFYGGGARFYRGGARFYAGGPRFYRGRGFYRAPILARGYGYRRAFYGRRFYGRPYRRPFYRRAYWGGLGIAPFYGVSYYGTCWRWRLTPLGWRRIFVCGYPSAGWGYSGFYGW